MKKKKNEPDFNEIEERLTTGWYVDSGQRKRYLKSIIEDKKRELYLILLILLSLRAILRANQRKQLQNLVIS